MADVSDGFDSRLQRPVAVKRLRPALAADPAIRARFEREAKAAARLNHPAVVAIYDIGEDAGIPFIVMERMPGQTMADRLARGPLDQVWLRRATLQVLGAVAAAHAAGILHRDIKPGNVLIGQDGSVKVADFGIAAITDAAGGDEHHTSTGLVIGTPAYLAPERAQGRPATVQSDLYAVGVLLYEGLTGCKPYSGATPLATAVAAQHGSAPPIEQFRPDADPALVLVAARAMAVKPEDRFPSAAAMATALAAPAPIPAPPAPIPAPTAPIPAPTVQTAVQTAAQTAVLPRRDRPGHQVAKAIAGLVGTLLLVAVVVVFWPFGGEPAAPPTTPPTTSVTAPATTPPTLAPTTTPTSAVPVALSPPTTKVPRHRKRPTRG
jgi:serine/threonine-protein kinase